MSLLRQMAADRVASRIWKREPAVFTPDAAAPGPARASIETRLGWLDAPAAMRAHLPALREFVAAAEADGLGAAYLLGMGGSSLCAEVLRDTAPAAGRHGAALTVLDTTDEHAVGQATDGLDPKRAVFLVASKSGSTIEVSSLEHHFGSVMVRAVGEKAGRHFAAITDPGTALVAQAKEHAYRQTFINPPDIGGRYSALSLFGLVPSALLGLDLERLLGDAAAMAERCQPDSTDNPGLALGAFMAEQARAGRDKLTLLLPAALAPIGPWIEQLVAESTGKQGRGVLPVVDETPGAAADYGEDRAFVLIETGATAELQKTAAALEAAGHPVFRIAAGGLGGEFFRWEFATAVAGAGLSINPFDEPNVRSAKESTRQQLEAFRATGGLKVDPALKPVDGVAGCLVREHRASRDTAGGWRGRYVAILDYLPADHARRTSIDRFRAQIRAKTRCATTHGIGPRYLHSTGQYHKGGPNTGLFVLLTTSDRTTTAVPGADYSFSVLKQAQALGDFDALSEAGRDVVHVHFDDPSAAVTPALERVLWTSAYFG